MVEASTIFNRSLYRMRRTRAAAGFAAHDFLAREASLRIRERLHELGGAYPLALNLGCHTGLLEEAMDAPLPVGHIVHTDAAFAMTQQARGLRVTCDEEWLPFAEGVFDLVVSAWTMHHVNDLPGALIQIRQSMKAGGLFICVMAGAMSLHELRASLAETEARLSGGVRPHVAPFIEVRDGGGLMQRAGFKDPVVDSEMLHITYADMYRLMRDLRGMGETNTLLDQQRGMASRRVFAEAAGYYAAHFAAAEAGRIQATCELVTLTGWT